METNEIKTALSDVNARYNPFAKNVHAVKKQVDKITNSLLSVVCWASIAQPRISRLSRGR